MKDFIVIAYHTPDELYRSEAKKLVESLNRFGLEHFIREIPDQGGWSKNTNYKPGFIKECLMMLARPVLYVDVDAVFQQYPALIPDLDCDVACHIRDRHELLTGTLYFQPTEKAVKLIDDWQKRINNDPLVWEQRNMQNALNLFQLTYKEEIKFVELPAPYCLIFDIMANQGKPVIEHFQASRRCANVIV